MKTERRHDLETNELARRATVWIEKVKPYSAQIVGVVVVLLGLWVVATVWASISAIQDEEAWDAYGLALTSNDLEMLKMHQVANDEQYAGTTVQEWALAAWADRQLYIATRQYLMDRSAALERLQRIVGAYEQLAENADDDQVRNRATFGLARVYELQDKLDEAREQYDRVEGDLQPLARMYADRLLNPDAKETYAWLSTAELPRRSAAGGPGAPGDRPVFGAELPGATDPTGLNLRTLEDILGFPADAPADDRYETDDKPDEESTEAEQTEDADEATETGDDIFGEEVPAEEPPAEEAAADDPQLP